MADYIDAKSLTRTNKAALNSNGIQLFGVEKVRKDFSTGFSAVVSSGGDTTTITPSAGHINPRPRYFKYVITDQSGNEAFGAIDNASNTSAAAALAIDTSGLVASDFWTIEFSARQEDADGAAQAAYPVVVSYPAAEPTVAVSY